MIKEVLIDMDGVIADYVAGVAMATGQELEVLQTREKDWKDIKSKLPYHGFFSSLPEMPLVKVLKKHPGKWKICSACGKNETLLVEQQKRDWLKRVFGYMPECIFTTRSKEKAQHATPNTLLVDDRERCLVPFSVAGGKIFHYKNTQSQDNYLDKILQEL